MKPGVKTFSGTIVGPRPIRGGAVSDNLIHDLTVTKQHLLGMLATVPIVPCASQGSLSSQQWIDLSTMASQHRLEPILHGKLRSSHDQRAIPLSVKDAWAAAFRQSAIHAMLAQSTLLKIAKTLEQSDTAYAALKGACLAWHVYTHPALRPMRDLDILVSPESVLDAYQALIAAGFEPAADDQTPVTFAMEHNKHLPGLLDPKTGIYVELHLRLFDHQKTLNPNCLLSKVDELLTQRVWRELSSSRIAFLPVTETLLHLIVHSALEHHFDNGPQVLNDIDAILKSEMIDWPHFWTMAKDGGWERASQLLFALTERYHGAQPIQWAAGFSQQVPSDVVEGSALMMLQDFDQRGDLAIQLELVSEAPLTGRWRLWEKAFPHRHVVASFAKVRDHPAAWLHYPAWLLSRLWRTLAGNFNRVQRTEAVRAGHIVAWLEGS